MNHMPIILLMIKEVQDYIRVKKGVDVRIDVPQILMSEDQLNKLIDAYNHARHFKMPE
jgi:hypothetical protein